MDKLTYEQRVQQMAEKMAIAQYKYSQFMPDGDFESLDEYSKEITIAAYTPSAKIAVAAQAEAIREALQYVSHTPETIINAFLGQNGYRVNSYEPAPEVSEKEESAMEVLFGEMCDRCKRNVSCCKHKGVSVCLSCCNKLSEED